MRRAPVFGRGNGHVPAALAVARRQPARRPPPKRGIPLSTKSGQTTVDLQNRGRPEFCAPRRHHGQIYDFCLIAWHQRGADNVPFRLARVSARRPPRPSIRSVRIMIERRTNIERRKKDIGPPKGCPERRKCPDRRLPVTEEAELSPDEFARLFRGTTKADAIASEHAAAVLERASGR